jgi:hypothetical protein
VVDDTDPGIARPLLDRLPEKGGSVPLVMVSSALPQGSQLLRNDQPADGSNGQPAEQQEFPEQPTGVEPSQKTQSVEVKTSTQVTKGRTMSSDEELALLAAQATSFSVVFGEENASNIKNSLSAVMTNLGNRLAKFADNILTLEVSTYVCDELQDLRFDNNGNPISGAKQVALTQIKLDGDMKIYLPKVGGEVDTAVWEIHNKMVEQAQEQRAKMLKMTLEVLSDLVPRVRA